MALIGLSILCAGTACSEQPAQPQSKSKFTQAGLDAIAAACGLKQGSLVLEGASSVRFGSAVTGEYRKLNCVQKKINEIYYPVAKAGVVGNENILEGGNAQTH